VITTREASARALTISVVTPSYNQGRFLERAIRSVLDQQVSDLEYFVIDGGSSDDSVEIIRRYAGDLAYWQSERDNGQASAVNIGWSMASGDILGWLNSDDFYLPGALNTVAAYMAEHSEALVVYGKCMFVDPAGRPFAVMGEPFDGHRLARGRQMIPQPSTFIRREVWQQVGPLDESLRYALDYDFLVRVSRICRPQYIDRALAGFTVHRAAKTTEDRAAARMETLRVAQEYASGVDAILLRLITSRARIYHALPAALRTRLDAIRRLPVLPD